MEPTSALGAALDTITSLTTRLAPTLSDAQHRLPPLPIERVIEPLEPLLPHECDEDPFLYHVTTAPVAERILAEGFGPGRSLMGGGSYRGHSTLKTFFTDRSGVTWWMERAEAHAFDQFDEPPEIAVLRIPRNALADDLVRDPLGSEDRRTEAYAVPTAALRGRRPVATTSTAGDAHSHRAGVPSFNTNDERAQCMTSPRPSRRP